MAKAVGSSAVIAL